MSALRKFTRIFVGILKELADESAYRRHLEAHHIEDSGQAWRQFSSERFRAKFVRPRCC